MRYALVGMAVVLATGLVGCAQWRTGSDDQALRRLVADVQHEASRLPESPEKDIVVRQLASLEQYLAAGRTAGDESLATAADGYDLFGPKTCAVSYFTEFSDFNGDGTTDGLTVFVELADAFGDPVKALGRFRIETFQYLGLAIDKRGAQLSNWVVNVFAAEDVRRYYDNVSRGFRFPLQFAGGVEGDRLIVQVTYYLPDGSGRKLFSQRVVKAEK